jgi:hypothetical protein
MSKQKYPQGSVTSADGTKAARKGREFYSHAKADARKDKRRDEADARQAKYDAMTTQAKIASCEYPKVQVAPSPTPLVDAYKAEKAKRTPKSKVVRAAKTQKPSKS